MTLEEAAANIGRRVIYRPPHTSPEEGVIAGVSETFHSVFVRYDGDEHAKATYLHLVEFAPETGGGAGLGGVDAPPPSGGAS